MSIWQRTQSTRRLKWKKIDASVSVYNALGANGQLAPGAFVLKLPLSPTDRAPSRAVHHLREHSASSASGAYVGEPSSPKTFNLQHLSKGCAMVQAN